MWNRDDHKLAVRYGSHATDASAVCTCMMHSTFFSIEQPLNTLELYTSPQSANPANPDNHAHYERYKQPHAGPRLEYLPSDSVAQIAFTLELAYVHELLLPNNPAGAFWFQTTHLLHLDMSCHAQHTLFIEVDLPCEVQNVQGDPCLHPANLITNFVTNTSGHGVSCHLIVATWNY